MEASKIAARQAQEKLTILKDAAEKVSDNEKEYVHLIEHSLGLTKKGKYRPRWAYRNYYESSDYDQELWNKMIFRGYAIKTRGPKEGIPYTRYAITKEGIEFAGLKNYVPKELFPTT